MKQSDRSKNHKPLMKTCSDQTLFRTAVNSIKHVHTRAYNIESVTLQEACRLMEQKELSLCIRRKTKERGRAVHT